MQYVTPADTCVQGCIGRGSESVTPKQNRLSPHEVQQNV